MGARKSKDNLRKWMWLLLGVVAALQLLFVRELAGRLSLFVLVFGAIAGVIVSFYMLQKSWEAGVSALWASRNSWVLAMRRGRQLLRKNGHGDRFAGLDPKCRAIYRIGSNEFVGVCRVCMPVHANLGLRSEVSES